jgi:hypothetical protein
MCGSERVCLCWCVQVRACVDTNIGQAAKERGIAQATELGERGAQRRCHCSQGTWKRPVCSRRCPARSRSGGRSHCALPVRPSCQMPCAHGPVGAFGAICAKSQSPQCSKIARRFRAWFHRTVEMRMWHYEGGTWLGSVAEERPLQPSGCRPDAAQPHRTGLGTIYGTPTTLRSPGLPTITVLASSTCGSGWAGVAVRTRRRAEGSRTYPSRAAGTDRTKLPPRARAAQRHALQRARRNAKRGGVGARGRVL